MTASASPDKALTIAVTGGAGFLGVYILQALLGAGHKVKALQNHTKISVTDDRLEIVQGHLLDDTALERLVAGCDTVVHAAGLVAARSKDDFFKINKTGTYKLFDISRKNDVNRFLYVSSIAAREPDLSNYAASKLAGEVSLRQTIINEGGENTGWDIVRPPAIYGPGDEQFLPLFKLLQKRIGILPAGRAARVSVIHAEDMAEAVRCWVESGKSTQHVYELDDGKEDGYLWQDILGTAADILQAHPHYIVLPRFLLLAIAALVQGACLLAQRTSFTTPGKIRELCHRDWVAAKPGFGRAFDWKAAKTLENGLAQTLQSYKDKSLL